MTLSFVDLRYCAHSTVCVSQNNVGDLDCVGREQHWGARWGNHRSSGKAI